MHAADHHLRDAGARGLAEQRLQQDDERLGAAQAEQLAGRDAGAQAVLEGMGAGELGAGSAMRSASDGARCSGALGLRLQPGAARGVVDVADVPADAAAVGGFQRGDAGLRGCGVEAVPARVELGHLDRRREAERIEPGLEIAARAIGLGEGGSPRIDGGVAGKPGRRLAQHVRKAGLQGARIAAADQGRVEVVGSHRSVHRWPCSRGRCARPAGNLGAAAVRRQRAVWSTSGFRDH